MSLEVIWLLQGFPNNSMVVDFAIDRKSNSLILVGKWLSSTVDTNDAQTFVGQN